MDQADADDSSGSEDNEVEDHDSAIDQMLRSSNLNDNLSRRLADVRDQDRPSEIIHKRMKDSNRIN